MTTRPVHQGELLFNARLLPHRSLSRKGFFILMASIGLFSLLASIRFLALGLWPVPVFFGFDVTLIYIAFAVNYRAARAHERVELSRNLLVIRKVDRTGRSRQWSFEPYWVRVEIDPEPDRDSQLAISSHGRRLVLGQFLTPLERLDFARALRRALAKVKTAVPDRGQQHESGG